MDKYNVLDLFCSCGGMSWGLSKKGFNIVAGIDIWDVALSTYQHNHKNAKAINLDITDADPMSVLNDIGVKPESIDVIIGGPPCQGFSKNTPASWRFLEDPRNQLYKAYLRFVQVINPKVVIIENVAEIYNAFDGVVQSFSDDFHFLGSRNDQAGQIGNAVPPYFMEQLADKIIDALQGKERVR